MARALDAVEKIGLELARPAAREVDQRARFPAEAIGGLRSIGALGASVPNTLGGGGAGVVELARTCVSLGQHCASSAMVLAMHHIQVLCIARHRGSSAELADYLRAVAAEQRLIASVTSEVGTSGDLRRSVCALEMREGSGFELTKKATTLSYGEHADDLLITARRGASAAPNDQILVLARRGGFGLSEVGSWDAMGMRGTCSPGAVVKVRGERWQILPDAFGEIAMSTMTPVSHILWSACWLGIATDAVALARGIVRQEARAEPGVVPRSARRLSEVVGALQLMQHEVFSVAEEYEALTAVEGNGNKERLGSLSFALKVNNLKLNCSRMVVEIVSCALGICGIQGYKNDSPYSLSRQLRDAYSAALMINNDRIHETNASLLMVHKGS